MSKIVDITGLRFGRLTVKQRQGATKEGKATWICQCDCGKSVLVSGKLLRSGQIVSCGCFRAESVAKINRTHGKSHTRLYYVWMGMRKRCYDSQNNVYSYYGGRGITVCDEWRDNFQSFYDWAIANGYDENAPYGKCTIDRIDVNGKYEPSNCRWVSMAEQNKNKGKAKMKGGAE